MRLDLTRYPPPESLRPYVAECYALRAETGEPLRDVFYASGVCEVVFNVGLRFHRGEAAREAKFLGQILDPLATTFAGRGISLGLVLSPRGVWALAGGSAARLNGATVALAQMASPGAIARVTGALEHDDVALALERSAELFAGGSRAPRAPALDRLGEVLACVDQASPEGRVVGSARREVALSERQLQRLCREYVGISLAHYARVVRFNRFLALAERGGRRKLTDLSYASGYYDQSHCTREVRRLSGKTPRALLAERRPLTSAYRGHALT